MLAIDWLFLFSYVNERLLTGDIADNILNINVMMYHNSHNAHVEDNGF